MNDQLWIDPDVCYERIEKDAHAYFQKLVAKLDQKKHRALLLKDIKKWKSEHIRSSMLYPFMYKNKPSFDQYQQYFKWMDRKGRLDRYLERSVAYILMRDLGKDLSLVETRQQIEREVNRIKRKITKDNLDILDMAQLYRKAQKEGMEYCFIWLVKKLNIVSTLIPKEMDAEESKRKLLKIIAGVVMHQADEMDDGILPEKRREKLDRAIRLGYAYGLTYPFIDDLLDANVLSKNEQEQFSNLLRQALVTGEVPKLGIWTGKNKELIQKVYAELSEAFTYIQSTLEPATKKQFFEQAYVFFHSQEVDRKKDLNNPNYTNEEIYIPVIIKSASSRLIARSVVDTREDEGFQLRTFYYGIYNQLADDFADIFADLKAGAVTPYTYFLTYHQKRPDLINPFELYWTVITYLIHDVYHSDPKTREVILSRAINGLKRHKQREDVQNNKEILKQLAPFNRKFRRLLQTIVKKADDVDFYDKLLRDQTLSKLKQEQREREHFSKIVQDVRKQVNQLLHVPHEEDSFIKEPISSAANYSLKSGGKRLRPILAWMVGVYEYGLNSSALEGIVKSLEYMHTASLIFDDLPSQDNADIRRGRPTLHEVYNSAIAELTGLYLTQQATLEQASMKQLDPEAVLRLIRYSSKTTAAMCRGQAMDLESKGKKLSLDQLNTLCFYKTGLAFEASLLMPGLAAGERESELEMWKAFAYHAGIAFQIKDDLLDAKGDADILGKPAGKDADNRSSTFVSALGEEEAEKMMWDHYCSALEILKEIPLRMNFLKHYLDYMINRTY